MYVWDNRKRRQLEKWEYPTVWTEYTALQRHSSFLNNSWTFAEELAPRDTGYDDPDEGEEDIDYNVLTRWWTLASPSNPPSTPDEVHRPVSPSDEQYSTSYVPIVDPGRYQPHYNFEDAFVQLSVDILEMLYLRYGITVPDPPPGNHELNEEELQQLNKVCLSFLQAMGS